MFMKKLIYMRFSRKSQKFVIHILGKMQKIIALEANIIQQFPCKCWSKIIFWQSLGIFFALLVQSFSQVTKSLTEIVTVVL